MNYRTHWAVASLAIAAWVTAVVVLSFDHRGDAPARCTFTDDAAFLIRTEAN